MVGAYTRCLSTLGMLIAQPYFLPYVVKGNYLTKRLSHAKYEKTKINTVIIKNVRTGCNANVYGKLSFVKIVNFLKIATVSLNEQL